MTDSTEGPTPDEPTFSGPAFGPDYRELWKLADARANDLERRLDAIQKARTIRQINCGLNADAECEQLTEVRDALAAERVRADAAEKQVEEIKEIVWHDEDEFHKAQSLAQSCKDWVDAHERMLADWNDQRKRAEAAEARAEELASRVTDLEADREALRLLCTAKDGQSAALSRALEESKRNLEETAAMLVGSHDAYMKVEQALEEAQRQRDGYHRELCQAETDRDNEHARAEEAQRDAGRLDWLIKNEAQLWELNGLYCVRENLMVEDWMPHRPCEFADPRKAIDAAIAARRQE